MEVFCSCMQNRTAPIVCLCCSSVTICDSPQLHRLSSPVIGQALEQGQRGSWHSTVPPLTIPPLFSRSQQNPLLGFIGYLYTSCVLPDCQLSSVLSWHHGFHLPSFWMVLRTPEYTSSSLQSLEHLPSMFSLQCLLGSLMSFLYWELQMF